MERWLVPSLFINKTFLKKTSWVHLSLKRKRNTHFWIFYYQILLLFWHCLARWLCFITTIFFFRDWNKTGTHPVLLGDELCRIFRDRRTNQTHTYSIDSTWHTFMCSHPMGIIARDSKCAILSPCQLPVIKLSLLHNYNTIMVPITYSKTIKNNKPKGQYIWSQPTKISHNTRELLDKTELNNTLI